MDTKFQAFSTTLIGSMPRSQELLALKTKRTEDDSLEAAYQDKIKEETRQIMEMFERVGIDIVVSGELSRDNYMSYVAEHVPGIQLMTMDEVMALISDKQSFNESLDEMDAADNTMNSPVCVDLIDTDTTLDVEEMALIKSFTDKPFKMTLPSPYLLTRSMWVKEVTGKVYRNKKLLGKDVVTLLINEIRRLIALGAKIIQIDEPILSEVVFTSECDTNGDSNSSFY